MLREDAKRRFVRTRDVIRYSAGGFHDARIPASPPEMWRDIFLNNRETVLEMLGRFTEDLTALRRAIRWGESDKLHDWFERTREIRQGVVDMGQAGSFNPVEKDANDVGTTGGSAVNFIGPRRSAPPCIKDG